MKKLLLLLPLILVGCGTLKYDSSDVVVQKPLQVDNNIPYFNVKAFDYSPPSGLTQYDISNRGCLVCKTDGGSPIKTDKRIDIFVTEEIKRALADIMLTRENPLCTISGTVNLINWWVTSGDSDANLSFIVYKDKKEIYKKRITGKFDSPLFGYSVPQSNANAIHNAVDQLVNTPSFLQTVKKECS